MPEAFVVEVIQVPGETYEQARARLRTEALVAAKAHGHDSFDFEARDGSKMEMRQVAVLRADVRVPGTAKVHVLPAPAPEPAPQP